MNIWPCSSSRLPSPKPALAARSTQITTLNTGKNVFVGLTGPAYRGFPKLNDLASEDRRVDTLSELGLTLAMPHPPATQAAADIDDLLTSRRKTVADVHQAWFEIYRPAR